MRRRGRAGCIARGAFQQDGQLLRGFLQHRADEGSHHVAQEAVRGDLELESVATVEPRRRTNLTRERSWYVSVGVNARKSCSPIRRSALSASAA